MKGRPSAVRESWLSDRPLADFVGDGDEYRSELAGASDTAVRHSQGLAATKVVDAGRSDQVAEFALGGSVLGGWVRRWNMEWR